MRYTVSKTFSFCYGHRLMNDDGRCKNLHGHTARATLTLGCDELDANGMVVHFDRLKGTMGAWIDENLDHAMLLCTRDPAAKALEGLGERFFRMEENPTAENIAKLLFGKAEGFGLPVISVEVWESETARATFTA